MIAEQKKTIYFGKETAQLNKSNTDPQMIPLQKVDKMEEERSFIVP